MSKSYKAVDKQEKYLKHIGTKYHSGRYAYGSGENPYQHDEDFLARYEKLKKDGLSDTEIGKAMGNISTTRLRAYLAIAKNERRKIRVDMAKSLKQDGLGATEIARKISDRFGEKVNESTVRGWLDDSSEKRMNQAITISEFLKERVDKEGMIDVGKGSENELSLAQSLKVSKEKLNQALIILEEQGYPTYGVGMKQVTNIDQQTNMKVLCKPGTKHAEVYQNIGDVKSVIDYTSDDGGLTFKKRDTVEYPSSLDSKRVAVRYSEDGGNDKDGVIEIRRGVKDLSLGKSNYAQVRILVDDTHYLKGMAMYSDGKDWPKGVDIMFNTNKSKSKSKMEVLKEIEDIPGNPFGAYIPPEGQSKYIGKDGKEHLSPINKLREEGDWGEWSKNLSSQFLSKQPLKLVKKQLDLSYSDYENEYKEILSLENKTVKRTLLSDFADNCEKAAVDLKAASLPRQQVQVLLPINSLKNDEVYAPNFTHGEKIALVRYPHGGTFEIPILKVNNNHKESIKVLGKHPLDAIGINTYTAETLSGADFDGDFVVCIPTHNGRVTIQSTPRLPELEGFDPKTEYPEEPGMKYIKTDKHKGTEMGKVSNLITDMTIKGAPSDEIARATKHSMVVIDAKKHKLNYQKSYKENGIAELEERYQKHLDENGKERGGASTLISRASASTDQLKTRGNPNVNPVTGEKTYKEVRYKDPKTGKEVIKPSKEVVETYINKKTGKEVVRTRKSTQMADTNDAYTLSSGYKVESYYADYANKLKSLARQARREEYSTGRLEYNKDAKEKYSKEVLSLNEKLNKSELNAPRERRANGIATSRLNAKLRSNPDLKENKKYLKRLRQMEIEKARTEVGADGKGTRIDITDKEWEAIQAGAISDTKLSAILRKADPDRVRELATPKTNKGLSNAQMNRLMSLYDSGNYTLKEIAEQFGISASTVAKYVKNK